MSDLLLAVFGAGLIGSVHCAAMCGGLVAVYAADPAPRARWQRGLEHAAYNGGRLAAYACLGAAAGALGGSVDLAACLAGAGRVAALAAGTGIVLWGALSLLEALGVAAVRARAPRWLRALARAALRPVASRHVLFRAGALGAVTGLMPCGWLYAFALAAAGTASPAAGAGVMAAFWAGTVPTMAGVGVGLRVLAAPLCRYAPGAAAVAMIVIGLLTVAGRVGPPGVAPSAGPPVHSHGDR